MGKRIQIVMLLVVSTIGWAQTVTAQSVAQESRPRVSAPGKYEGYNTAEHPGYVLRSRYVSMSDGVRLAVDTYLPQGAKPGQKFPTILYQTRYGRRMEVRKFFRPLLGDVTVTIPREEVELFTRKGYAVVAVDVRGTGASFGTRDTEFGDREVQDGRELLDWIAAQPWSDGKVGATGASYLGTVALMLASTGHPALKAIAPRSAILDLYADVGAPGGLRAKRFIKEWAQSTRELDNNDIRGIHPIAEKVLVGMSRVDEDANGQYLLQAIAEHQQNVNIEARMQILQGRNTREPETGLTLDQASAHRFLDKYHQYQVPTYWIGGWQDGAFIQSSVNGFRTFQSHSKLLIGPWGHAQMATTSPGTSTTEMQFSIATELLRFFDYHLKSIANGFEEQPPVTYYLQGDNSWQLAENWPERDADVPQFWLEDNFLLSHWQPEGYRAADVWTVDTTVYRNRYCHWDIFPQLRPAVWEPLTNVQTESAKLLNYTTPPLAEPLQITGSPVLEVEFAGDSVNASLFAWLEDVHPDGSVTLVTTGQLNAGFRALANPTTEETCLGMEPCHSFRNEDFQPLVPGVATLAHIRFLPTAYRLPEGHRLRVSLAGADRYRFDALAHESTVLTVFKGGSRLILGNPATGSMVASEVRP
jgi:putative CocE/NonD family hydrolase